MKKKKKNRSGILLDMTPMVDIAILLLIFYMTTTQFKPPVTREVVLPRSHSMINLPDKDVISITVTDQDSVFVDAIMESQTEGPGGELVMTKERIYESANEETVGLTINKFRTKLPRALIVIRADRDASYGIIQKVMDNMVENHLKRFQIVTDSERET